MQRSWILVIALAAALAAGCGDDGGPPVDIPPPTTVPGADPGTVAAPSTSTRPPAPTTLPTATTVTTGEPGFGVAFAKSDVDGLDDSPYAAGTVLFVPATSASEFEAIAGVSAGDRDQLAHVFLEVEEEALGRLDAFVAPIGEDARFRVPGDPGSYLVCLADTFADHTPGPPYSVVGCAPAEIPAGASPTVSFGEGGVEVSLD